MLRKMLAYSSGCSLLLILFIGSLQGSPITSTDGSAAIDRRAKADEILRYMNTSVDPCEDFYEFTCGNYAAYNPTTMTKPEVNLFGTLLDEHKRTIELLLNSDDETDTITDKKVKAFYKSCLQTQLFPKVDQMRQLVNEFGAMPALEGDNWNENDFDLVQTVAKIAFKYGTNIFANIEVGTDVANDKLNSLYITSPNLNFPKSVYQNEQTKDFLAPLRLQYVSYLKTLLGLEATLPEQTASEILDFEKSLAKGLYDTQAGLSLSERFAYSSIDQAYQRYSKDFDFKQLINTTFGTVPNLQVYIEKEFVNNLWEVLRVTPKKVVANYIYFNLITGFIFKESKKSPKTVEEVCLAHTKMIFFKNLENMAYRKYLTKDSEEAIDRMWLDIKAAFQSVLESERLGWVSESTRKYALEKLNAITLVIPSFEDYNFEQELGHLNLDNDDYLGNLQAIFASRANISRAIDYSVPQPLQVGQMVTTTPAYVRIYNNIWVPVALLQPLFVWSGNFPNAYNFAVLGSLLAHELIHGYDGQGRLFNAEGRPQLWWQENSDYGFTARSKCFAQQYHQYIYADQHLPAMGNQNENIADNGGIRLAYAAYNNWLEKTAVASKRKTNVAELETFEGLNYKDKQLFFISYGYLWCSDIHPHFRALVLKSDSHVPTKFRVIGPLSNMEEFSQEFNCPRGSGMNPVQKCEIY